MEVDLDNELARAKALARLRGVRGVDMEDSLA